ncbi:hypothetical protein CIB48_g8538 [Xylaria polymorpha]|nr:hypothetical protein CIB48_g8538 [Xylaria polymorpha]
MENRIKVPPRSDDLSLVDRLNFENTKELAGMMAMMTAQLEEIRRALARLEQAMNLDMQRVLDSRSFVNKHTSCQSPRGRMFDRPAFGKLGASSSGDPVERLREMLSPNPAGLPLRALAELQAMNIKNDHVDALRIPSPHSRNGLFLVPPVHDLSDNPHQEEKDSRYKLSTKQDSVPFQRASSVNVSRGRDIIDTIDLCMGEQEREDARERERELLSHK